MMSINQDIIGQFPGLKTYNHATLGFMFDEAHRATAILALQMTTEKLTSAFPWLSGAVVNEGSGPDDSGIFKIIDWPQSSSLFNQILRVKDCSDTLPSLADFILTKAPCSSIQGELVAPFPGFPECYEDVSGSPAPVFAIQVSLVEGGILLNFSTQCNAIDTSGMMQVIKLFSMAMRDLDFPPSAIKEGNRDRTKVIPLIAPGEPIKDHSYLYSPITATPPHPPFFDELYRWAYFLMDESSIPLIKAAALHIGGYDNSIPFISGNDAISAFYWKCIACVRLRGGQSPAIVSKFLREFDARPAMGVSAEYMGSMMYHASTRMTYRELQELPISTITCKLRKDMNDVNNGFSIRSYATHIANTPDKSLMMYGGPFNADTDISVAAVPNTKFSHSFGVIGEPQFARRPNLAPIPGCVYFMPSEGRHVPILVCLRNDDIEGLKTQPDWSRYTEFIG